MAGFLKFILISFLVFIIGVVIALGYFGFLPVVSDLFGTNDPKDLGMRYSQENFDSALEKSGVEMKTLPSDRPGIIAYEGSHEVEANFSDEELTAHANNRNWVGYPVADMQVRINDDDIAEVSGILKLEEIGPFLEAMNISEAEYKKALEEINIPIRNVPFYARGYGTAANDTLDVTMTNFEVGRFPVPRGLINEYQDELNDFGHHIMRSIPGFSVKEARFEDGGIYFDGELPDAEYTKR